MQGSSNFGKIGKFTGQYLVFMIKLAYVLSLNQLHFRTWMEMRAEFKLNGGERVEISERTQMDPLFMGDCSGIFLLWLMMLSMGVVGYLLEWIWFLTNQRKYKREQGRARQGSFQ